MEFKTMTINDIIEWCQANNQVEWLKATAAKTEPCEVYPRVKKVNENGKVVSTVDKTQKPTIENRSISFISIKTAFCKEFMPDLLPKATTEKKPSMYELIANL